jgi:hypothetical protein
VRVASTKAIPDKDKWFFSKKYQEIIPNVRNIGSEYATVENTKTGGKNANSKLAHIELISLKYNLLI